MFKVLLVDDEPAVIQLLEKLIDWKSLGYVVCGRASNGEEALEFLKQYNPHLAIVDIRMPKVNGLQLLQQASEILYLRTKFIISSAYSEFEYAKTAMRYGVSDYILKPIDDEEILPALMRVTDQIKTEIGTLEAEANKLKFAANNYINRLIKDEISEELLEKCKRILSLKEDTYFRCALLEISQFEKWMNKLEDLELQRKRLSVRKAIEDTVGNDHVLKIFEEDIHRFGIILTEEFIMQKENYLENLKKEIEQKCGCLVCMSLSEKARETKNVGKLYRQALIALQYRLFQSDREVLYYEKFKNISLNYNFYETNPENLVRDILSCNLPGIEEKIKNVFDEFYDKKCATEVITNYIKSIEFELVKNIQAHNGRADEIISRLEHIAMTVGKTSIDSLKEDFYDLVLYLADYYKNISCRSSKDIIIEIKNYIHQNYQKDLKLQQVAKEYFVNPVYLGQVFAKTAGMHFTDYLHSVRIEEAKKLLRRTNMKISAIASMVGYSDSEYFVNKFKAITHQVPSDYRKKQNMLER
ncbi:response regulator transcription factor [Clostridium thermarum]|uniref:response regulator transcription factor n=1 Tax=Clostridium thermarum TaxID=1716543 RepID=UPI00111E70AA|nr:response regulator [Clostridium thermarum]